MFINKNKRSYFNLYNLNNKYMSRLLRYQNSIADFIKKKSTYSNLIKSYDIFDTELDLSNHEAAILMITVSNGQFKKHNMRTHHGYYIASGIDLMMLYVNIYDNIKYYKTLLDDDLIKKISNSMNIYVFETISQNIEILEDSASKDKLLQTNRNIVNNVHLKLLELINCERHIGTEKPRKTDIIKYRYEDKDIIDNKYKKLKLIKSDNLMNYVESTYGVVCQTALIVGWLLGGGDNKLATITRLNNIGMSLGYLIKISRDFKNIERDMNNVTNNTSNNMVINMGIYNCFELFDKHKISFLEGIEMMDIYSITIKEMVDNVEKIFDSCLENTDLELKSLYSSSC